MAKKKELYKLAVVDGKVLLRVPPQLVGAETANLDDIQRELHMMDAPYLPERLLEIYERNSGNFEELSNLENPDYTLQVDISEDEQTAYLNLIPPPKEGNELTEELLRQYLDQHGITAGILSDVVQKMISEKVFYDYVEVARGRKPRHGTHGTPELLFLDRSGFEDLTGVDLRNVPMLQKVTADQVLARVYAPTDGDDGYTVNGRAISAIPGKICRLTAGTNTRYSSNRNEIMAMKAGVACYHNGALHVHDVKSVDNIHAGVVKFDGVLQVRGNIGDSCRVEAFRIEVSGSVGHSQLRATSDIHVQQSIVKGILHAGGSVSASELMEANITAGEHVLVSGNITNSTISAGECLRILDETADASGGKLQGGYLVLLPNIGTQPGATKAEVEVGISLAQRKHIREQEESVKEMLEQFGRNKETMDPIIRRWARGKSSGQDQKDLDQLTEILQTEIEKLQTSVREIRGFQRVSDASEKLEGGAIIITKKVSAGTVLFVRRTRFNVVAEAEGLAYTFTQSGVQSRPYEPVLTQYRPYLIEPPEE